MTTPVTTEARAAPRPRRWRRWLARLALAGVALLALAYVLLSRDPTPHVQARRGAVAGATLGPALAAAGHLDQDVRVASTSGLEVELRVRRPDDGGQVPRPTMVLLGGRRTGRRASELVPDTHGVVLAALSYPFPREDVKGLGDVLAARRAILDTPAAILLAHDWLRAQPYVDPERVELVGVSLGAPFACVAGAMDARFRRVWSVHGGGSPARLIANGLRHDIGWKPLRLLVGGPAAALAHGLALAPEDWVGRIAPRPFVMVNGRADDAIPRECVELLYEAAREPKELVWVDGGHIDKHDVEQIRGLVRIVLERME